jgi:hypothetical protein
MDLGVARSLSTFDDLLVRFLRHLHTPFKYFKNGILGHVLVEFVLLERNECSLLPRLWTRVEES